MNSFPKNDSKNWTFLNMNQWNEPSLTWLEERNFFQKKKKMTQRIEISWAWLKELIFFECDSKNWIFEFLSKKKKPTQRIELFSKIRYKELNFFSIWLKDFFNMTRRIEPFFLTWLKDCFLSKKTQRIWLFLRLTDLNLLKIFFRKNDSKNWSLFFTTTLKMEFFWSTNTTHRTDFFFFSIRLKELNFFENDFFRHWTFFFFEYNSKNWNSPIRLRGFNFFFSDMTQSIELFLYDPLNWTFSRNMTWLIELNLFFWTSFQDDSKSWSLSFWLKELNLSCFPMWLKELKFFLKMSQRI